MSENFRQSITRFRGCLKEHPQRFILVLILFILILFYTICLKYIQIWIWHFLFFATFLTIILSTVSHIWTLPLLWPARIGKFIILLLDLVLIFPMTLLIQVIVEGPPFSKQHEFIFCNNYNTYQFIQYNDQIFTVEFPFMPGCEEERIFPKENMPSKAFSIDLLCFEKQKLSAWERGKAVYLRWRKQISIVTPWENVALCSQARLYLKESNIILQCYIKEVHPDAFGNLISPPDAPQYYDIAWSPIKVEIGKKLLPEDIPSTLESNLSEVKEDWFKTIFARPCLLGTDEYQQDVFSRLCRACCFYFSWYSLLALFFFLFFGSLRLFLLLDTSKNISNRLYITIILRGFLTEIGKQLLKIPLSIPIYILCFFCILVVGDYPRATYFIIFMILVVFLLPDLWKEMENVCIFHKKLALSALSMGMKGWEILWRAIRLDVVILYLIYTSGFFASLILVETSLSFIGYEPKSSEMFSLGKFLQENRNQLIKIFTASGSVSNPFVVMSPLCTIIFFIYFFNRMKNILIIMKEKKSSQDLQGKEHV